MAYRITIEVLGTEDGVESEFVLDGEPPVLAGNVKLDIAADTVKLGAKGGYGQTELKSDWTDFCITGCFKQSND
jgi:hypothetical protein